MKVAPKAVLMMKQGGTGGGRDPSEIHHVKFKIHQVLYKIHHFNTNSSVFNTNSLVLYIGIRGLSGLARSAHFIRKRLVFQELQ